MFVCGIVGPIFLAIYFATQPDPSMKWAYWAGLFITTADILIALALTTAGDQSKAPADTGLAIAGAKRMRPHGGHTSESSSSAYSSSTDFSSFTDYSSSSDSGSSSSDCGSSSSSD